MNDGESYVNVPEIKTDEGRAVGPDDALYRIGRHLPSLVLVIGELVKQQEEVHRVIIHIRPAMVDLHKVGVNALALTEKHGSKGVEEVRVLL